MELNLTSLGLSVVAGLLSFLSPCVLPLLPAYLAYLGGASLADLQDPDAKGARSQVFVGSLLFVAGLAVTFTLFGATATLVGRLLIEYQPIVLQVAGVLIIVFGLHVMGVFRLPFLDRTIRASAIPGGGRGGAFLMGAAFGVGWTPCIGPFLAGVLTLAGQETTVWQGVVLLLAYALGLGVPFVLSGLAVGQALQFFRRIRGQMGLITRASGVVLVLMGVLVFSGQMLWLSGQLARYLGTGLVQ